MIFSLFGRKPGRKDGNKPARPSREPAPVRSSGLAEKIDAIESEMIRGGPATQSGPSTLSDPSRTLTLQTGVAGKVVMPSSQNRGAPSAAPISPAAGAMGAAAGAAAGVAESNPGLLSELSPYEGSKQSSRPSPSSVSEAAMGLDRRLDASAIEISGSQLPPACEEAAVLYSNGQYIEARVVLEQAVDDPALGSHQRQAWLMLFDLLQGIGEQESFDALALRFSERFETSPPSWDASLSAPLDVAASSSGPVTLALPALVDAQVVRVLEQARRAAERGRAVDLDLRPVRELDPLGAELLRRALESLGSQSTQVHLIGAQDLLTLSEAGIENGRRDDSDAIWLLMLELLRLLNQQQAFEDRSIDYCVTYEVSPPSWEAPSASLSTGAAASPRRAAADAPRDPVCIPDGPGLLLMGDLEGRVGEVIAALRQLADARNELFLDCRRLRRVDFGAAGELLNEIMALKSAGKRLRMGGVSPLVGALLAVMGIPDLIEVRLRGY